MIAAAHNFPPLNVPNILFTKPYLSGNPLAIVSLANQPKIKNVTDLAGKTVVVNEGYTADFYMSKFENITILRLESPDEAFLALDAKRADAFVAAQNQCQSLFKTIWHGKIFCYPY